MSLLDRLRKLFEPQPALEARSHWVHVRCRRCGEIIAVRVDLQNDLSMDYEGGAYVTHKTVVGDGKNRCFQRLELDMRFDSRKQLISQEVTGGEIVAASDQP